MTKPRMRGRTRRGRALLWGIGGLLAGVGLPGCIGYATYEPTEDEAISMRGPNHASLKGAITESLRWTIKRYPPSMPREAARRGDVLGYEPAEAVAVGLPRGLSRPQYLEILDGLGPAAKALTEQTEDLPTYVIGRIELRVGKADVDVHRPLPEGDREQGAHQLIELSLENAFGQWRVYDHQIYAPGVVRVPEPGRLPPEVESGSEPGSEPATATAAADEES